MMLTNLADILRGAGLPVHEEPGWKTHGHGGMRGVRGVMGHHTAGAATGWYPSLGVVRDGRPGLAGPLSQLGLARDGTWICIAAGRAWHAGSGYHPAIGSAGNDYLIGVEAENTGLGQPWPPEQIDSYRRGTAALLEAFGLGADRYIGHKEWAPNRKIDPFGLDMDIERQHVANYIMSGDDDLKPDERQWLLDIHKFLYEAGFIRNKIDPDNPTKGADMIPDMALWVNQTLGHVVAARVASEKAAEELTAEYRSAVPGSTFEATAAEYAVLADRYGYENAQRLEALEAKLDKLVDEFHSHAKVYTEDK